MEIHWYLLNQIQEGTIENRMNIGLIEHRMMRRKLLLFGMLWMNLDQELDIRERK